MNKVVISLVAMLGLSASCLQAKRWGNAQPTTASVVQDENVAKRNTMENKTPYDALIAHNSYTDVSGAKGIIKGEFEIAPKEKIEFSGNVRDIEATIRIPVENIPAGSNRAPFDRVTVRTSAEDGGRGSWELTGPDKKNKFVVTKK